MESLQKTIKDSVRIQGVGLHTGNKVNLVFKPAEVNFGINFVRTDLNNRPVIKADCQHLLESERSIRRTSLGSDGVEVQTIEHLMAVLLGLQIDNLLIEIDSNEVPGMDGSGSEFAQALKEAGTVEQERPRKFFTIKEPLWVEDEQSKIVALPDTGLNICYTLNYNHPFLKSQYMELAITPESFMKELAPSRTFCLKEETDDLQGRGLGKGANYQNTLVVAEKQVIQNTLRFDDEFVRHKILDLIGDIFVLGFPIKGRIIAIRSGHALNLKLVKKIFQQKLRYETAGIAIGNIPQALDEIDTSMVMKMLPHRYPFLLVDKILSLEQGKRAIGIKNVTINENFFLGHFPGKPVMPGVLIIEAMAQVGGVMMLSPDENRGKLAYFMAANDVKFRKTVLPGDQLVIEVKAGKIKSKTGQVFAKAYVDNKTVCEAELMFALA
jgi:UDP-3-O-[3-hydroxymyristoyl] N-acetylglucosamine deacetylase/3-hydroxyacyl-[acyl-carrier-protein] dehydratase